MKDTSVNIVLFLLVTFFYGCNPFEFEGEISVELINDQIRIENLTNTTVYYHAGDSETMARISGQYSSSSMQYVKSGHFCTIDIENVSYYDEETKRVTVYWLTKHGDQGTVSVEL